jgi:GTP-binding protein
MQFNNFEFEASYGTKAQLPPSVVPEIAFAGRSNVGKSSLLNKLLNRKSLARTSSMPGKTITVNFFRSEGVKFVDLPGYGYAKVPQSEKRRWAEMMEGYFTTGRKILLVVQLLDMRHKPSIEDFEMLSFLKDSGYDFIIALTKCDKLNKTDRLKRMEEITKELADYGEYEKVPFSSQTGEGTEKIKNIIGGALNK